MQMVIEIPEEVYKQIKGSDTIFRDDEKMCYEAVQNGTSLPKEHGRLKDIDWIDDNCPDYRTEDGAWCYKWEDIDNAPTIIEEDKGDKE